MEGNNRTPPSQTAPAVEQRWGWDSHHGNALVVDEFGFTVVGDVDEKTARHIVGLHNKAIRR